MSDALSRAEQRAILAKLASKERCSHQSSSSGHDTLGLSFLSFVQSRVSFYVFMSVMESLEAQQRGIVAVYYLLDATNFQSVTGKLRTTLPIQFGSIHLCYNDITQYAVTCIGVYSLPNRSKVRFRPHFGKLLEAILF